MANCSFFLSLLCTFLIINTFLDPIHGKSIGRHQGLHKHHHKRSLDPVTADLPAIPNIDDPQIKKYAQQGVEKLSSTGSKSILEKIIDATFFPPAGKLLYEIKIKVKTEENKDDNKQCTVNVWRESDAEPSVTVECVKAEMKKRSTDESQPEIADLSTKLKTDDAEVTKYAQMAVEQFGSPSSPDRKAIVKEIEEATSFPPSGKLLYKIKLKIGITKCSKESDEKNCEIDPEAEHDNCEVNVFRETDKEPSMSIVCHRIGKRAVGQPQIADLPSKQNVDDPQVKSYAQKGIEKLAETSTGPSDPILEKILEATFFPPAGKLLYEIKIKAASKTNKDISQECTVNVWRESDADPSVTVECGQSRRRRAVENIPKIMDLPIKLKEDDAQVIKYAKLGIQKYAETSTDSSAPVLEKIIEAYRFHPVGKLDYKIKILMGMCSEGGKEKCQLKADGNHKECTVYVWRENAGPSVTIECGQARRRRSDDGQPQIADLPSKSSVDDPQVKNYAQKGIEKLAQTSTGPSDPILEKILEATFFPPAGKLLYEIKTKVASKTNKDVSQECTVNVWRESDAEPSVTVECGQSRRRRSDDGQPQIADLPSKSSVDDPQVKNYAQKGIEKLAQTSTGPSDPILEKILEATFFPPAGKLLYEIKTKVASKTNKDVSQECTVNVWRESDAEPSVTVECGQSRRRRSDDGQPQIADLPSKSSVDDPQVKNYAQKGIEKLAQTSTGPSDPILEKILEATFFPPAGKLLYEIKTKVASKTNKDVSQECTVNVWRESDAEPSVTVECSQARRRRSDDGQPQIADLPSKSSVDDPQVKNYAQKGIEKLAQTSTGPSDPILEKILEATFFPPAGKLLYEIKIKAASKTNKDVSQECTVNVWRESDAEPSVTVECGQSRRRRSDDGQPQIADLPSKSSVDDPQVKNYAQKGIEKLAQTSTGPSDPILEKILEATFFPPAGKLLYEIKTKVASKTNKDNSQECTVNVWRESDAEPSVTVECGKTERKKRATEEEEQPAIDDDYIADLPVELSVTDPEVKKYAQQGLEEYSKKSPKSEAVLVKILEAFYIPESSFSHSVKVEFGKKTCLKNEEEDCEDEDELESEICTIYIPNAFDESIDIQCGEYQRKKRAVEDSSEESPVVGTLEMDKPLKISLDEPEVKKYAQKGVETYAESSTGPNEPILEKIEEALLYPPSGKQLFEIKIKIGTSTCSKGQKENCELKADGESKPCTVNVIIENDKPRVELKCD